MKRKFFQEEDPVAQLHSISLKKALLLEELLFLCAYYEVDRNLTLTEALSKLLHINFKSPNYALCTHYVYTCNIEEIKKSNISLDFKWYPAFEKICKKINDKIDVYSRVDWLIKYGITDYATFVVKLCPDLLPPESNIFGKYDSNLQIPKTDIEAIFAAHFSPLRQASLGSI